MEAGRTLLLNGRMLTGRDAAHKRIADLFAAGGTAAGRRRFHESRHLLRRTGRPGARRSGRTGRTDDGHAHGQVHADDAGEDGPPRDDRQGGARTRRDRGDPQARRRLPDGRRRRRVSACRRRSARRASWPSATSAWKPSTNSTSRTCRSPSPSTRGERRCITPRRANGRQGSARFPSSRNDARRRSHSGSDAPVVIAVRARVGSAYHGTKYASFIRSTQSHVYPMKIVNRLRRHLSPLAGDTVTMLDLPPVRMGLLTKLNLLTIGLIFLTAVAMSVFHFAQQWRDEEQQLREQGTSMLGVMARARGIRRSTRRTGRISSRCWTASATIRTSRTSACSTRKGRCSSNAASRPALAKAQLPPLQLSQAPSPARPRRRSRGRRSAASATSNSSRRREPAAPGDRGVRRRDAANGGAPSKADGSRRSGYLAWA